MSFDVQALGKNWTAGGSGADVASLYTEDAVSAALRRDLGAVGRPAFAVAIVSAFPGPPEHDGVAGLDLAAHGEHAVGTGVVKTWAKAARSERPTVRAPVFRSSTSTTA